MAMTNVLPPCDGLPREMLEMDGLPEHTFERMDFLWRAAHHLRLSSPAASRMYSVQLRKLAVEQDVGAGNVLPEWIRESMCVSCGSVFTPGINCRVRVRSRSLSSPSVKSVVKKRAKQAAAATVAAGAAAGAKRPKKCRNEVVTTCTLCDGITCRGGTERRAHHNKRRKGASVAGANRQTSSSTPTVGKNSWQGPRKVADKLRGNFIPLGNASQSKLSSSVPTNFQKGIAKRNNNRERGSRNSQETLPAPESRKGSAHTTEASSKNLKARSKQAERRGISVAGSDVMSLSKEKRAGGGSSGQGRGRGADKVHSSIAGSSLLVRSVASGSAGTVVFAAGGDRVDRGKDTRDGGDGQAKLPSLLEQIQRSAKKKRRRAAATTAAAKATVAGAAAAAAATEGGV